MSANIELLDAVGYARVSTETQADHGIGLETQLEKIRAYALIQQLNLVEIVEDRGVSGTVPVKDRPGGQRLLALLGKRKVRHVVALKLDRLFRNTGNALGQIETWDRQGVTMHLIDMGGASVNTSSAVGRIFLTMMAGFAQFERDLIAERTSAALATKRAKLTVYTRKTPLGYDRVGNDLVPVEGEQKTIRRIMALRDGGMSLQKIADRLNGEGVHGKEGGAFYASTIQKIVGNELHAG